MIIEKAQRLNSTEEYYFATKLREIAKRREAGENIINLGIGSPDQMPPNESLEELVIQSKRDDAHGYQSYTGIPQLRNAFTTWYDNYFGVSLNPETEVLPLMGSKEGIMHISLAFLNPGDKVLVPDPGYPAYNAVANIVGAEVIKYNLTENNSWLPDFDELEEMASANVKILWVNYPHMPTGTKATREMFEKLIEFAKKHQILVVNDNPYSFILNEEPLSILSVDGAKEVAVELNSLSKSHNMAGWRIGCVAGAGEYLKCILTIKSNMDSGMFKPLQLAAVKALGKDKNWYQSINTEYAKRQLMAMEIFDQLNVKYDKAQTGMFVWGKIPPTFDNSFAFSDHFLYSKSVFFTPGAIFGKNGEQYVRISLCSKQEVFKEVISRLEN
ncbi:MAG: aminotransferase class I/II-fold pyridoxal phosphate-dependent enzyme [Bacteroidales bacterium]|nr:aminotransferase class I/II-fold pyridoxal phosphate-dependent enzyme [Bacteroidales bacterium]